MTSQTKEVFKKENPLQLLERALGMKLLQYRITKFIFMYAVFSCQILNAASIYMVVEIQGSDIRPYIPYLLFVQSGLFGLTVTVIYSKLFHILKVDMDIDMQSLNKTIRKKITSEINLVIRIGIVALVTSIIAHVVAAVPIFEDDTTFNPVLKLMKEYGGSLTTLCISGMIVSVILIGFGLSYPVLFGLYLLTVGRIQSHLRVDKLLRINEGFDHFDQEQLMYDEFYQNIIYERLTGVIKHHTESLKYYKKCIDATKFAFMFVPVGALTPAAVLYFIYTNISPKNNFRMVPITVACFVVIIGICILGQKAEDASYDFFRTISETPWIFWNKKNRQALLILMMNAKTVELKGYTSVNLNYRLLLRYSKWIYSVITILYNK